MRRPPSPTGPRDSFPGFGERPAWSHDLSPSAERDIIHRLVAGTFDAGQRGSSRGLRRSVRIRARAGPSTRTPARRSAISAATPSRSARCICAAATAGRASALRALALHAADTFHLIRCGVVGGKGVPEHVVENPLVFATLTAPSFGAVHGQRDGRRCHLAPGRTAAVRMAGPFRAWPSISMTTLSWGSRSAGSATTTPRTSSGNGGAELWRRFTITCVAWSRGASVSGQQAQRPRHGAVRKGRRVQLRGVVHFHALVRLDVRGSTAEFAPAPVSMDAGVLADLVAEAAAAVRFSAPDVLDQATARRLRFGTQVDTRPVRAHRRTDDPDRGLDAEQVAGCLAKYSTKSATESAGERSTNPTSNDSSG